MTANKTLIYQTSQIRELEALAQSSLHLSEQVLMERAAESAFELLRTRFKEAKKIVFLCGYGKNGGDGYLLAHLCFKHQLAVSIWQIGNPENIKTATMNAMNLCQKAGIVIQRFSEKTDLAAYDLIVDAILGIGLVGKLKEETKEAIQKANRSNTPILSIDIPSGVCPDTGCVQETAITATTTITFIGLKLGLLTGPGLSYTGELVLSDLQLPDDLFQSTQPSAQKIQFADYAHFLPPRRRDWHKGMSGHVLVIGGDHGFSGAVRMAAEAALRIGAGLVSVATHPDHAALINLPRPEIMSHGISKINQLDPLLAKAKVVVIGPGLGQDSWGQMLWKKVSAIPIDMIVDADGLNLLAKSPLQKSNWILTPHPGEASRLLKEPTDAIQDNRLQAVKRLQEQYGGVALLKGAGTLVFAPNELPGLCHKGNPGMATAGMGDVLSGILGGLVAQGLKLSDATKLGVILHATAGDLAAIEGERGMLAMDLMPQLRHLANASTPKVS